MRLSIYSAAGRAVQILDADAGAMEAGLRWDTRTNAGQLAAPGVYWVDARDVHAHQAQTHLVLVR